MLCSEPIQRNPQRGAAEGRPPLWRRPKAASFVLALNKAHVLALNTTHVLRLNKADALALKKAHVLRLNNKICPVFRASHASQARNPLKSRCFSRSCHEKVKKRRTGEGSVLSSTVENTNLELFGTRIRRPQRPRIQRKRCHQLLLGPPLPHAPGARMT